MVAHFRALMLLVVAGLMGICSLAYGASVDVRVLASTPDETTLEIVVNHYKLEPVALQDGDYQRVEMELPSASAVGTPEIPVWARTVGIPFGASALVEVLESRFDTMEGIDLAPAMEKPKRCENNPRFLFAKDLALYASDAAVPSAPVELGKPVIMHGLAMVPLRVFPVSWNPASKTLKVARRLVVRIAHPSRGPWAGASVSNTFFELYGSLALNFEGILRFASIVPSEERLVVIGKSDLEGTLNPFLEWKRTCGFDVRFASLDEIGPTSTLLGLYLQGLYDSPATRPTYVILVGDIDWMPTNHGIGGCASDFMYSTLEGNDLVSDILVSRISANSVADLELQLEKFISYESQMSASPTSDWLAGAIGISSSEGTGESNDDVRMDIVTGMQESYGYAPLERFYHSTGNDTASNISDAIDEGRGFVTYLGHGSGTSWATTTPNYDVGHIGALLNRNLLVTVMDVSCSNGGFDVNDTCFAEAWMRANDGGTPTGAVAIYSASTPAAWDEPAEMAIGVVEALTVDSISNWGALCLAGRTYMQGVFGESGTVEEVSQQYVVFGDGSLMVRSRGAMTLEVEGPSVLPVGEVEESFRVTTEVGIPVENARLRLFKAGEVDLVGFTDSQGEVTFQIGAESPGAMDLSVVAFDAVAYHGTIDVVVTGCGIVKTLPGAVSCDADYEIQLWEQDLNGDSGALDVGTVSVSLGGSTVSVELTETGVDSNKFTAVVSGAGLGFSPVHGDLVTVSYNDESCEGSAVVQSAEFTYDCQGPVVGDPTADPVKATEATLSFATDEGAICVVTLVGNLALEVAASGNTSHLAVLEGLVPSTEYTYFVTCTDPAGNVSVADNGGLNFTVTTPACSPDCTEKACGDDGCGGSCGVCGEDQECTSDGVCFGGAGCEPSNGGGCGGCLCEVCVCDMDPYCCQSAWDEQCISECMDFCGGCGACTPDCEGKECGDDGCGGSCGDCGDDAPYCSLEGLCGGVCEPDCVGLECGDDGCGGECGQCSASSNCEAGVCVLDYGICGAKNSAGCSGCACEACVCSNDSYCCNYQWDQQCAEDCFANCGGCGVCEPDCTDKECGDDGCFGTCGMCQAGLECFEGTCQCTPECDGFDCGDDGCGGTCGECEEGDTCIHGHCTCIPDCSERECGNDGCGGSCGACKAPLMCGEAGQCLQVCEPQCDGVECGEDGCGGVCGFCPGTDLCVEGLCVCEPSCFQKECGDNGCGVSCGACNAGWVCSQGTCVVSGDSDVTSGTGQDEDGGSKGSSCASTPFEGSNSGSVLLLMLGLALLGLRRRFSVSLP